MTMTKEDAVKMIDRHKNKLINPVEMLHWTRLRVIINNIPDTAWQLGVEEMERITSQ